MSRLIKLSLVSLACLTATNFVLAADNKPDKDVLVSDSFEKGTNAPDNWKQGPAVPGVKYVYERGVASEGKRSLGFKKSANRFFPIAGWGRVFKHDSKLGALHVSVKVKAQKAAKAVVDVQFLNAKKEMISHEWVAYIGQKEDNDPLATHDWKEYEGTVEIPADTQQIAIALQIYGPGDVWFDELTVRYVDPNAEPPKKDAKEKKKEENEKESKQDSSASIKTTPEPTEIKTASGGVARYLAIPPTASATKPKSGFPLLLVLPGGDGSTEFHPFVRAIHEFALQGQFVVAQVVAPPQIVWPTKSSTVRWNTTNESVCAIVDEMVKKQSVDRQQVYALAWSSSGPAVYELALQDKSPLAGAFIAMSVFKPGDLPKLTNAKGRRFYLLHSPEDAVCPFGMAKDANDQLTKAGAIVTLVNYSGGHGWHGPVHDLLKTGMDWLQRPPKSS